MRAALLAMAGCLLLSPSARADVKLTLEQSSITAAGITPGGEAIVFAALIGTYNGHPLLLRQAEIVIDDDRDGSITIPRRVDVRAAVWTVVDQKTGAFGITSPTGKVRLLQLAGQAWRSGVEDLEIDRDVLEVLLVRPGVGAWTSRISEGGSGDADGNVNSKIKLRVPDMDAMGKVNRAAGTVQKDDVLVLIDPRELQVVVIRASTEP
jgi:hypothetical protein